MFPSLQRSGELSFAVASNSLSNSNRYQSQPYKISQDLVFSDHNDHHGDHGMNSLAEASRNRRRRCKNESVEVEDDGESTRKKKHREIEKQRRREMAGLYAALRSLLPLEYIKGKRSISDHMNEAVNYIKHLHLKLDELRGRQDRLKQLAASSVLDSGCKNNSANCCRNSSVIEIVFLADANEVEIILSKGLNNTDANLELSVVLELLLQQGLDVTNCFSTKINNMILNKIHCKAYDVKSMDLNELRQKLAEIY